MTEQTLTTEQIAPPKKADLPDQLLFWLAVLALALAPTQLAVTVKGIALQPAMPVLLLAAGAWALRWFKHRDFSALPPLSHWLIIFTTALSAFAVAGHFQKSVLKETVQTVFYLVIAFAVFRTALTSAARIRIAVVALLVTTTLAVGLGIWQRYQLDLHYQPDHTKRTVFHDPTPRAYLQAEMPFQVCSTFATWGEHGYYPSKAGYAGFLALVLPFALALLVSTRRCWGTITLVALLFVGVAVSVLAGYLLPAMLLGLLVTGFALGTRTGGWTLLGIAAYLGALALIGGHNRTEMLHEPWQLRINAVEAQDRYREDEHPDGVRHLKKFWGEQQAALNAFRNKPLLGTGAGEYQKAIAQSYDLLGDIEEQRLEPDAQNGYLLAGVGTGLLGLAALLALFGEYFGLAWRARAASPWAAAMLGAITALLVLTLATNPWVRGTTVVVVALFAMIANSATEPPPERISQQEEIGCES